MIVKPGPVIDFLLANQNVQHPDKIDWTKVMSSFDLSIAKRDQLYSLPVTALMSTSAG